MKNDYTSLDLSKRLHEAGFRGESDYCWAVNSDFNEEKILAHNEVFLPVFKAHLASLSNIVLSYSAQSLLDALPSKIKPMSYSTGEGSKTFFLTVVKTGETEYFVSYENLDRSICSQQGFLLEALGEMVLELIKRGIINPNRPTLGE